MDRDLRTSGVYLPEGTCWMRSLLDLSSFESERIQLKSEGHVVFLGAFPRKDGAVQTSPNGKPVLGTKLEVPGFRISRLVDFFLRVNGFYMSFINP